MGGFIIAVKMSEYLKPEAMKDLPESELYRWMNSIRAGAEDRWAQVELSRRQNVQIGELISALEKATNKVSQEVAILSTSSDRVERLTISLKWFTKWLLAIAVLQTIIAGVQTWKMFQPEKPVQVIDQPAVE